MQALSTYCTQLLTSQTINIAGLSRFGGVYMGETEPNSSLGSICSVVAGQATIHNNNALTGEDTTAVKALKTHLILTFLEFLLPWAKVLPKSIRLCVSAGGYITLTSFVPMYVTYLNFKILHQVLGKLAEEVVARIRGWFRCNQSEADVEHGQTDSRF